MNNNAQRTLHAAANFLFEVGMLAQTPRSAFYFLGTGKQSVAEHLNRTAYVGMVLSELDGTTDTARVMQMCLFHDIAEARTSDLNYVHQQYVQADEKKALAGLIAKTPFGKRIEIALLEYHDRQTPEAILAKDADNLEWILSLKELLDLGNPRAEAMLLNAQKRLKSLVAQQLAHMIVSTPSDAWYLEDQSDQWWINRKRS